MRPVCGSSNRTEAIAVDYGDLRANPLPHITLTRFEANQARLAGDH